MKTNIKISILIPVYKVEKFIEQCITSILFQNIKEEIEVIIVNDCTPDSSIEVLENTLKSNPPRANYTIKIINHERNRGQAAARNTALKNATGIYTLFIDSDDYIDTDMLDLMYTKALETDADIVMVDLIKEYTDKSELIKAPYYKNKAITLSHFIRGESIYLCNKLIRKSLYDKNNLFFREGYNMSEDYAIMIPLSFSANKIEHVANTYYHYIQYNTLATTKKVITQHEIDGWLYSVNCLTNFIINNHINGYDLDILYRKLIVKYWCMLNSRKKSQKSYANLYPEIRAKRKELLSMIMGRQEKIKYFLVANGYAKLFNLFLYLKSSFGKN